MTVASIVVAIIALLLVIYRDIIRIYLGATYGILSDCINHSNLPEDLQIKG